MEPLDLTKAPPRSPKAQLDGLTMLPRTIDKLRASLPGGQMGEYKIAGFSARMLETIGVNEEQLRDAVRDAASEDDVAQWLRQHADTSKYAQFNEYIAKRSLDDVQNKEDFKRRYPIIDERPDLHFLADIVEADDAAMFSK